MTLTTAQRNHHELFWLPYEERQEAFAERDRELLKDFDEWRECADYWRSGPHYDEAVARMEEIMSELEPAL